MPPPSQQNTDGNNRITLATISAQITALTDRANEFYAVQSATENRLREVETLTAINKNDIATVTEDVAVLEKVSERWSIINSIVAAGAAIAAAFGLSRQ